MQCKTGFARILILSLVSFLALAACGGDESPPFVCNLPGCTLTSQAGLDGAAASNNTAQANDQCPFTGDRESMFPGLGGRQFYSFDLSSIPATATVTSATLRLFQGLVLGSPYTSQEEHLEM